MELKRPRQNQEVGKSAFEFSHSHHSSVSLKGLILKLERLRKGETTRIPILK